MIICGDICFPTPSATALKFHIQHKRRVSGFTLTELLVAIAIIAVLAILSITATRRVIENGRKVKTLVLFEGD